jgi:hypothetical protein
VARVTADDAAKKWARNLGQATQDITAGIARVSQAPGVKAAQASGKWLQKVTQAETKFKANVGRVGLSEWQAAATAGVSRVASGANAKQGKMAAFMTDFLAHLDRGAPAIAAMATNTVEDGIAKAAAQIRHNANFKRSGT